MNVPVSPQRPWAAIAAATVLTLPLGSIYAFSVFLKPIEAGLSLSRSALSLVFGMATVGFTAGMNIAPMVYRLASPAVLIVISTLIAATGIAMAAWAGGLVTLLLGYGVVFGIAGGVIFNLLQQAVNLLVRSRIGLLNGYILGLYPMGAMIAAPLFDWSNTTFNYHVTLLSFSAALLLFGAAGAWLLIHAGAELPARTPTDGPPGGPGGAGRHTVIAARLCAVFFLAAAAGLTVLSQAAGIIAAYDGAGSLALWATTGITAAIACARVSGGWLVDRFPVPFVSCAAHAIALTGTVILTLWPVPLVAVAALAMIGTGYGLVSGSTAGGIAVYWPKTEYGFVASKIFIAWCVAAVTLPVLAGHLFDLTGGYRATILIAGCGNFLGCAIALGLPREAPDPA